MIGLPADVNQNRKYTSLNSLQAQKLTGWNVDCCWQKTNDEPARIQSFVHEVFGSWKSSPNVMTNGKAWGPIYPNRIFVCDPSITSNCVQDDLWSKGAFSRERGRCVHVCQLRLADYCRRETPLGPQFRALELIPLNSSLQFNSGLIQVWRAGKNSLGCPVISTYVVGRIGITVLRSSFPDRRGPKGFASGSVSLENIGNSGQASGSGQGVWPTYAP